MRGDLGLRPDARVCIVLLTGIGDVVMGLPLANALRRRLPAGSITWVAEPAPAEVLRHHPAIDEVVVYRKSRGVAGVVELRKSLAGRRFDLTLNLNVYFKSVWPTLFSGAPTRIGFGRDRAHDGVWLTANRRLPARPRRHTLDTFLEFAEHLGVEPGPPSFGITFSAGEDADRAAFFARFDGRPVAAIVPASGNPRKDWEPSRYGELIGALEEELGYRTLIVGGPTPREASLADRIEAAAAVRPLRALGDDVRRMMWTIGGSDLVISPDSGPVHVARALEVPVIGLYGHTNPYRVGPYRKYEDLWIDRYTDEGEAPDPGRFDPKHGRMERITVSDVLDRVERARTRYGGARR